MNKLSPENQFLLISISGNVSAKIQNELSRLSNKVDWTKLIEIAYQHDISGLLCDCLINVCPSVVPEKILIAAEEHQKMVRNRNQQFAKQLVSVVAKLSEENIDVIPFKGIILCQKIYGDLALRSFSDQDFLIRKQVKDKTLIKLNELGYSHDQGLSDKQQHAYYEYGGQDILFGEGAPLEPHWTFSPTTFSLMIDYDAWWQRSSADVFNGVKIRTFQTEDEFILLCIHGSKEKWTKLKWLADLAAFIHKKPDLHWNTVFQRASEQGVERMVYLSLQLCRELLEINFSPAIQARLNSESVLSRLVFCVKANLFDDSIEKKSIYSLSWYYWHLREHWSDRLRYVFLTLVTPRTTHFQTISLPDRLFFLYYPYKPLHDLLLLPAWILCKKVFNIKRAST